MFKKTEKKLSLKRNTYKLIKEVEIGQYVSEEEAKETIKDRIMDKFLIKYLDNASSGFIYKMLRKKNITLNSKKASGNEILAEGDRIVLFLSDETISKFKSCRIIHRSDDALTGMILYEDEHIIAKGIKMPE